MGQSTTPTKRGNMLSHRLTQKYRETKVLSEFGCEHGYLKTSWHPYDHTDEEIERILKWWRDRPETTQEQMDKQISFWDGQKTRRDEFYFELSGGSYEPIR